MNFRIREAALLLISIIPGVAVAGMQTTDYQYQTEPCSSGTCVWAGVPENINVENIIYAPDPPEIKGVVTEYVDFTDFPGSIGGHYFYTNDASEKTFVDSGAVGNWKRTGHEFYTGGSAELCRFYGSMSPGPNSHFYTISPDECQELNRMEINPKPTNIKQWNLEVEGSGMSATPASNGNCPTGTRPIYRAYNDGYARGFDSNHRYSSDEVIINLMVTAYGWKNEGVAYCAAAPDLIPEPITIPPGEIPSYDPSIPPPPTPPKQTVDINIEQARHDIELGWFNLTECSRVVWVDACLLKIGDHCVQECKSCSPSTQFGAQEVHVYAKYDRFPRGINYQSIADTIPQDIANALKAHVEGSISSFVNNVASCALQAGTAAGLSALYSGGATAWPVFTGYFDVCGNVAVDTFASKYTPTALATVLGNVIDSKVNFIANDLKSAILDGSIYTNTSCQWR